MASWEMQLVSRILRADRLKSVLEWGLSVEDFLTDEGRQMFNHMLGYMQHPENGGARMGPLSAKEAYPNFQLCDDPSMSVEALCREVRKIRLRIDTKAACQRVLDKVEEDPVEAATAGDQMLKQIISLGYSSQTDVTFTASLNRIVRRMELMESGIDLSKAHFPWDKVNEVTGGIEGVDYIVYYGRPKSMKSWVVAEHAAYCWDRQERPMVYTKEMHADNIFMRIAACTARLPYQDFRLAKLNKAEKERLYYLKKMVNEMQASDDIICLSGKDAPNGQDTVEWLQAKAEKHKPSIIFIDGLYLMSDSKGSKRQKDNFRVQNISRAVRQMALDLEIPVVATIQANRDAAKNQDANLDEIAFSDAIGQDVTIAIRVINEKANPNIALVFGGSREFTFHGCRIRGIPATDFSYVEELTEKEINKARNKDTSQEEGGNAEAHTKKPKNSGAQYAEQKTRQMMNVQIGGLKSIS